MAGRRLHHALASLRGSQSKAARRARHVFEAALAFTVIGARTALHLKHTPPTIEPWQGWRDDMAKLAAAYPDFAYAVEVDADYRGRLEAAIAHDEKMEQKFAGFLAEARELLAEVNAPPPEFAAEAALLRNRLRELIDELVAQHRSYRPWHEVVGCLCCGVRTLAAEGNDKHRGETQVHSQPAHAATNRRSRYILTYSERKPMQ